MTKGFFLTLACRFTRYPKTVIQTKRQIMTNSHPELSHKRSHYYKIVFKNNSGSQRSIEKATTISFKPDINDAADAGRGPKIFTHFGSYSTRLKIPNARDLQTNKRAVVAYFPCKMDKPLGLSENNFEWLLANPNIIDVVTWTGHRRKSERIGRTINLKTQEILRTAYRSNNDGLNSTFEGKQNKSKKLSKLEDCDSPARINMYGFDGHSDRIIWWLWHPKTGNKIVLLDYKGSSKSIPLHANKYRMNLRHANNWAIETNLKSLERPKHNLEVDWMAFGPCKED
jgi:hypothetical protein